MNLMRIRDFSELVMVEQSLFGLPWVIASALLALVTAVGGHGESAIATQTWSLWLWIIIAFMAARTAGMAINRVMDQKIDAANDRTAQRSLPRGAVTVRQVNLLAISSLLLFVIACANINFSCLVLSPIVVILLCFYSYSKRCTSLCHFVLGVIHFFSPVFAWAAITNRIELAPFLIGSGVAASIAGSDIIYALQDCEFDRRYGLHSIPVAVGAQASIWGVRVLHGIAALLFFIVGILLDLGPIYFIGNGIIVAIYCYFHHLIHHQQLNQINRRFFYCNSCVALTFLFSVIGAIAWHASL